MNPRRDAMIDLFSWFERIIQFLMALLQFLRDFFGA